VTNIRIICTHDAIHDSLKTAETLMRLLEAEEHQVRLVYGRQSLMELESAQASRDAILLIWSPDAPGQHYMLEWARGIDPHRLVEIARAPGWPRIDRKAPVVDFTGWRGERGSRAWTALNERLRNVSRYLEPAKPPPRQAAMALGAAGLAAVSAAAMLRLTDNHGALPIATESVATAMAATLEEPIAIGGPMSVIEPASIEDLEPVLRIANPRFTPLDITAPDLVALTEYTPPELREPTLLERIRDLNPLRSSAETTPNAEDGA